MKRRPGRAYRAGLRSPSALVAELLAPAFEVMAPLLLQVFLAEWGRVQRAARREGPE